MPKFKLWMELETYKDKMLEAVENGEDFPKYVLAYVSTAFHIQESWFDQAHWEIIIKAFYQIVALCPDIDLPITSPSGEKSKDDDWAYEGRSWNLYCHMISKNYGWTLEYISQLNVVTALAIIQEILTDEQLDREFYYGLSEVAYVYDKGTRTSKFHPLPRPYWMRKKVQPIKKFKIPISMMPVGVVITDGVLPEEYLPQKINPSGNVEGL